MRSCGNPSSRGGAFLKHLIARPQHRAARGLHSLSRRTLQDRTGRKSLSVRGWPGWQELSICGGATRKEVPPSYATGARGECGRRPSLSKGRDPGLQRRRIERNSRSDLDAASGRKSGAQASLRFNRHIGAIHGLQFPHNISYVNFNSAFAHVQLVSYYLIRLAFLDRSSDRQFTACEVARYWWLGQHDAWRISRKQAIHWRIGPRPQEQSAPPRSWRSQRSHGYWNITFCAACRTARVLASSECMRVL